MPLSPRHASAQDTAPLCPVAPAAESEPQSVSLEAAIRSVLRSGPLGLEALYQVALTAGRGRRGHPAISTVAEYALGIDLGPIRCRQQRQFTPRPPQPVREPAVSVRRRSAKTMDELLQLPKRKRRVRQRRQPATVQNGARASAASKQPIRSPKKLLRISFASPASNRPSTARRERMIIKAMEAASAWCTEDTLPRTVTRAAVDLCLERPQTAPVDGSRVEHNPGPHRASSSAAVPQRRAAGVRVSAHRAIDQICVLRAERAVAAAHVAETEQLPVAVTPTPWRRSTPATPRRPTPQPPRPHTSCQLRHQGCAWRVPFGARSGIRSSLTADR
eukprot:TRINITY_DN5820_c2_g1_i2.p2 TRINITY_DN5820_c2_g1~~TRINITY_DN5820_c2_g1_i2.p2  ORF type:complete len:332 (+),score=37.71 TRINITY_DN5820_c2_g1_i2:280-1275(+)